MIQEVKNELKRLAAENDGRLRAEDVVAAAREVTSPLHTQFEWDDTIAGEKYRLAQARALIRVTVEYVNEPPVETRVFVSLTSDRKRDPGYRVVADVMNSEQHREQLLRDAMQEMRHFQAKFRELKELVAVFTAMRETDSEIATRMPWLTEAPQSGAPLGT